MEALPPNDAETEAGALSCVLCTDQPGRLLGELSAHDFYDLRHRTIFEALNQSRAGDVVALYLWLQSHGQLDRAGGKDFLIALPDHTPSAAAFPSYLSRLRELSVRRAVLRDSCELRALVENQSVSPAALVDAVHRIGRAHYGNGTLPSIIDAADFLQLGLPPSREVVWGVLHQGSKMVVGGASKTFKTWTLLDLAISVASGEPWLSVKTTRGRVLFVNLEIQPQFFQQRIAAVISAKAITLAPSQFDVWNLRGHSASYRSLIPKIIERVRGKGYVLVILDPIYKLYGDTDENSAGAVAMLLNALDSLTAETCAGVAFGAHYSKGNQAAKESIDRISGSGVFARDPDTILNFTRHEEEDAFTVEATLRNFKPVEPFVVRWRYPLMRRADDLDPAKLKQAPGRPPKHTMDKLLTVLEGQSLSTTSWQKLVQSEKGVPKSTFYELLGLVRERCPKVKQTQAGLWVYEDSTDEKS